MKSMLALLISLLFPSTALAASGTINIQVTPEGAKYFIVKSQDMKLVKEGLSPYFDTSFPTGKYKVCFQLDGYETVWQDTIVQTSGSAWVGPVMKKSADASQNTCANDLSGMKAFQTSHPVPMAGGSSSYTSTSSESFDQSLVEFEREQLKSRLESCPPLTEWKRRMACQDRINAQLKQLENDPEQAIYNSVYETRSSSQDKAKETPHGIIVKSGQGAFDTEKKEYYVPVGGGYLNPNTNEFVPSSEVFGR